ncbi:MAG: hypothetical protein QXL64_05120 [Thermofilaceae archaeon]
MVELERGIYRRVILSIWAPLHSLKNCEKLGWELPPFPDQASFEDGRVGYFLLAEAGFPYLAYALFSEDEPRDEKEDGLRYMRTIITPFGTLQHEGWPHRFYSFSYNFSLGFDLGDEMRRYIEWAEKLTLGDVEAMLEKLEELAEQLKLEPELLPMSAEWCLESLKNTAHQLRWLLEEHIIGVGGRLVVKVWPRVDEPGVE